MRRFSATHKITCNDDIIPVMAEEGHEGGLTRLGRPVHGSSLEEIAS